MHKEFLLRGNQNGTLQICTLTLGQVYPQLLVEEIHHLYCKDKQLLVLKGSNIGILGGRVHYERLPCALYI